MRHEFFGEIKSFLTESTSHTGSADLFDDMDHLVTINQRVQIGNTTSHPMVKPILIHYSKRRVC